MTTIRIATENDISGIRQLAEAHLNHTMAATRLENPDYVVRVLERLYSVESLHRAIINHQTHILIAESDNQVVGLCQFGSPLLDECEDRKEIHQLIIHPDYYRQGIGSDFLDAIEDTLSDDVQVARISVYVNPADVARLHFFLSQDFHHEATEDKDDEWYLELEL